MEKNQGFPLKSPLVVYCFFLLEHVPKKSGAVQTPDPRHAYYADDYCIQARKRPQKQ